MPKKLEKPTKTKLVALFSGDDETLKSFYPELGTTAAIRLLVHQHCNKLRERANRQGAQGNGRSVTDLDLDISDLVERAAPGGD